MKKINFLLLIVALLLLAACDSTNDPLVVAFDEDAELVTYMNVEFDVEEILIKQEGVTYTMEATYIYVDEETGFLEERSIDCEGLKFVQSEFFDVNVIVTAHRGEETAKSSITVTIEQYIEPLDKIILSCWKEDTISYKINNHKDYLMGEGSLSSIQVTFIGATNLGLHDGIQWLNVLGDGSHLHDENPMDENYGFGSEVTNWEDAVLVFYVFNPNEDDLRFYTRFAHVSTGKVIDFDWGTPNREPYVQTVKPGEWKLVRFNLSDFGIAKNFEYEEGYPNRYNPGVIVGGHIGTDMVANKVTYVGAPETGFYTFSFYVDGYRFVDREVADQMEAEMGDE